MPTDQVSISPLSVSKTEWKDARASRAKDAHDEYVAKCVNLVIAAINGLEDYVVVPQWALEYLNPARLLLEKQGFTFRRGTDSVGGVVLHIEVLE